MAVSLKLLRIGTPILSYIHARTMLLKENAYNQFLRSRKGQSACTKKLVITTSIGSILTQLDQSHYLSVQQLSDPQYNP